MPAHAINRRGNQTNTLVKVERKDTEKYGRSDLQTRYIPLEQVGVTVKSARAEGSEELMRSSHSLDLIHRANKPS